MKKTLSRFGALLAAAMLTLGVFAGTAFAAEFDYTDISGTTTKLHKYLVVEKDTVSPAITFTYTIAAGTAVAPGDNTAATTGDTLPIYAGPTPGDVVIAAVPFAAGDAATPGAAGQPITDTTKWYGTKDITLDFTGVTFDKPGIFRYILTEANANAEGVGSVFYDVMAPDGAEKTRTRTIDVYVVDNAGTLQIQGYVSYDGTVTGAVKQTYDPDGYTGPYANGDPSGSGDYTKSNQYINQIKTNTMTVKKVIASNGAALHD